MTAFDTDILSDLAWNVPAVVARSLTVPPAEQCLPIVVAEEVLRGQLATIRRAQAGSGRASLELAYAYLEATLSVVRVLPVLAYTGVADSLVQAWQAAKIRVGVQDLRIAAICISHGAKLITRNSRDYALVPGLNLEVWT